MAQPLFEIGEAERVPGGSRGEAVRVLSHPLNLPIATLRSLKTLQEEEKLFPLSKPPAKLSFEATVRYSKHCSKN